LQVVVEARIETGGLEIGLGERLETQLVEVLLKELEGESVVEDHTIVET
jgi:hypothetical protein